jgi:hypothetical protein
MANNPTFTEITFSNLSSQIGIYLSQLYNKAQILFSPASPYGQIVQVITELFQLSMLYQKNSINQFDLSQATSLNTKIVRTNAIIAGHLVTRSISSTGTLRFVLKSSTDIQQDIPGARITLSNDCPIRNKTNSLDYIIDLGGTDNISYQLTPGFQFFVNIIQGKNASTQITGSGVPNSSYSIQIPGGQDIENFNVQVLVDSQQWTVVNGLLDMLPGDTSVVVRTGFEGGIDVIFGSSLNGTDGAFGLVPPLGANIDVNYILTDGAAGNIFRRTVNDWILTDTSKIVDGFGNSIDISQYFDIYIYTDINFGADGESTDFTRNLLPIVSSNFVLGLPSQYAYAIKKLGVFSHVNAYEDSGIVYVVLTPNITLFKNANQSYFNVPTGAFQLDDYEKSKVSTYLRSSGNIQLTTPVVLTAPTLAYFITNIFYVLFNDADETTVQSSIIDSISTFMLTFNRIDRLPKQDILTLLAAIDGVDSIDIQFVSQNNENYHIQYQQANTNRRNQFSTVIDNTKPKPFSNYNPNLTINLDPVLGDIIFDASQLPILRGGWSDRYGIFYSQMPSTQGFSAVNFFKQGVTDRKTVTNTI